MSKKKPNLKKIQRDIAIEDGFYDGRYREKKVTIKPHKKEKYKNYLHQED
jgi:hypothetical protein